ncbi:MULTISPECIES: YHS domain-containing protein [Mycolicibacterium]|uniref:YHS domain-containing protein n=1 Tax=Mycolicibacterium TaxID=1866885 RepID=UPI0021F26198|nr:MULTISPECIES: YHS domain-containing protein [Mycolicibacterium]MCV7153610.1 YHS domain-containing protein [Mycolicibacterium pyrenivorans]WND60375.1 YHS domain-containing protein [Mycolicibacterium vanbaalenii]
MSDNQKSASSCCCSSAGDEIGTSAIVPTSRNLLELGSQNEATCPVMPGMPVNKTSAEAAGLFRDYRGRRYWFCCKGCGPRFDRDPDKYTSAA